MAAEMAGERAYPDRMRFPLRGEGGRVEPRLPLVTRGGEPAVQLAHARLVRRRALRLEIDEPAEILGHAPPVLPQQDGEAGELGRIEPPLDDEGEIEQCAERGRPAGASADRPEIDERRVGCVALAHRGTPVAAVAK